MKTYSVNNKKYYFDKNKFSILIKDYKDQRKNTGNTILVREIYDELAELCSTSSDNVKHWKRGTHGPGDMERIKIIAKYFDVDYMELLQMTQEEVDKMNNREMLELIDSMQCEESVLNINFATIKFMKMLDQLAEMTKGGYITFSDYIKNKDVDKYEVVIYDESNNRIVLDSLVDDLHDDIISYFDDLDDNEYSAKVIFDEDEEERPFIEVLSKNDEYCIVIEEGKWYFC